VRRRLARGGGRGLGCAWGRGPPAGQVRPALPGLTAVAALLALAVAGKTAAAKNFPCYFN